MKKVLVIIRGLPGAGKSSLAKLICPEESIFEADKYFITESGEYKFNGHLLPVAHQWCMEGVERAMKDSDNHERIVVSNTSTTEKEFKYYIDLAKKYDYNIISLVVENRHGNSSIHEVPAEIKEKMKSRFEISL